MFNAYSNVTLVHMEVSKQQTAAAAAADVVAAAAAAQSAIMCYSALAFAYGKHCLIW
jgi:hypothetical protein